jgi:hypothetical protein
MEEFIMSFHEQDVLYDVHNNQICSRLTGEIVPKDVFRDLMGNTLADQVDDYINQHKLLGIEPKFTIHKFKKGIFPCVSIKKNFVFNKIFRVKTREIMLEGKLKANSWAFIGAFQNFIEFPTNEIMINNQHLTLEELGQMIGLGKNKISKVVKELEYYDVIKVVTRHKLPPVIYFNPFLFCAGKVVHSYTYSMFQDSIYSPMKNDDEQLDTDAPSNV